MVPAPGLLFSAGAPAGVSRGRMASG